MASSGWLCNHCYSSGVPKFIGGHKWRRYGPDLDALNGARTGGKD